MLSACSSTEATQKSGDPADAYVDALATVFTSGDGGPAVDDGTARCAAAAMVDLAGVPALTSADITPQELSDAPDLRSLGLQVPVDAADVLARAFGECGFGEAIEGPFIDAFAAESGGDLSTDAAECVAAAASATKIEEGLAATFVDTANGQRGFEEVTAAVGACPQAVTELLLNGFEQSAGASLDDETRACVAEQVATDPDGAATTFTEGGAAADAFGQALLEACPGLLDR